MKTEDFLKASQYRIPKKKAGSLKLRDIVVMCDALSCIGVCCHHAFHKTESGMPIHFQARVAALQRTTELSLAKATKILAVWHKWTCWKENGSAVPTVGQVWSFLSDESLASLA